MYFMNIVLNDSQADKAVILGDFADSVGRNYQT